MHHIWSLLRNIVKNIIIVYSNPDITGGIKQGLEYSYPAKYSVTCIDSEEKCFELLE